MKKLLLGLLLLGIGVVTIGMGHFNQQSSYAAIGPTPTIEDGHTHDHDETALPLGDGQYSLTGPMMNGIYACSEVPGGGGATTRGFWIGENTWDATIKPSVQGEVDWPQAYVTVTVENDVRRVIFSNNLPDHTTGIFPIALDDPAYEFDRNPNTIQEQMIELNLPLQPELAPSPACLPLGPIGVMVNGVVLFNGLDLMGRDAVAWEIQDHCDGHPERNGTYHYHSLSDCLLEEMSEGEETEGAILLGWAFDGFGIYGPYDEHEEDNEKVTNADLDECHGHSHLIEWEGEMHEMYHYHFTAEYPYSIGCFKGTPVMSNRGPQGGPPGQQPPPPPR